MEVTDVVPVILIFRHLASAYGDILEYTPNDFPPIQPLALPPLSFQGLAETLTQLDRPQRWDLPQLPFSPLQQPNPYQQQFLPFQLPFSPFQQPFSPFQQPFSPFQQPNPYQQLFSPFQQLNQYQQPFSPFQQLNQYQQPFSPFQQLYQPQKQPYTSFLQQYEPQQPRQFQKDYSPLHQPAERLTQQLPQQFQTTICPPSTPTCADGRPAVCTRNAFTGFLVYSCPKAFVQNGLPLVAATLPKSNPTRQPNVQNATEPLIGGRSLLDSLIGPESRVETTTTEGEELSGSETRNKVVDSPSPTGTEPYYRLSAPLCSFKSLQLFNQCFEQLLLLTQGSLPNQGSVPFNGQWCKPGQSGCFSHVAWPPLRISSPPWSQVGYQQPGSPFSGLPSGSQAAESPSANPSQPLDNSNPYASLAHARPYSNQGWPGLHAPTANLYDSRHLYRHADHSIQNVIPSSGSPSFKTFSTSPQIIGTSMFPGLYVPPYPGSGYRPLDQQIRNMPQAYQNHPQFSVGYLGISNRPYQNFPYFQRPLHVAMSGAMFPNPFAGGDFGYQVPGMPGSTTQGSPLQAGYRSKSGSLAGSDIKPKRYKYHFSSPLGLTQSRTPQRNAFNEITRYQPLPYLQNLSPLQNDTTENTPQKRTPSTSGNPSSRNNDASSQKPLSNIQSYFSSGLSLLSLFDEVLPSGQKIGRDDKIESSSKPTKKTSKRK